MILLNDMTLQEFCEFLNDSNHVAVGMTLEEYNDYVSFIHQKMTSSPSK
ncbi:MAG: hypothetical protein FWF59_06320 [Turicibacter sp.]|nr:hypothetical protein [Turicibacter sp.]